MIKYLCKDRCYCREETHNEAYHKCFLRWNLILSGYTDG